MEPGGFELRFGIRYHGRSAVPLHDGEDRPEASRGIRSWDRNVGVDVAQQAHVAYNLAQARENKGWTQEEAAEALAPHLGRRWSRASFSAAERSVDGDRVRMFDADEIVAFARTFEVPVSWFFMPPMPWAAPGIPIKFQAPDADRFGHALAVLADLVFGDDQRRGLLELRLQAFLAELGPNPLSDAQQRVADLVDAKKTQLVQHSLSDLSRWQTQLRSLANHLEDLEARSARASLADLQPADAPPDPTEG